MNIQTSCLFVFASQTKFKDLDTAPSDVFFCTEQTRLVIGNELITGIFFVHSFQPSSDMCVYVFDKRMCGEVKFVIEFWGS